MSSLRQLLWPPIFRRLLHRRKEVEDGEEQHESKEEEEEDVSSKVNKRQAAPATSDPVDIRERVLAKSERANSVPISRQLSRSDSQRRALLVSRTQMRTQQMKHSKEESESNKRQSCGEQYPSPLTSGFTTLPQLDRRRSRGSSTSSACKSKSGSPAPTASIGSNHSSMAATTAFPGKRPLYAARPTLAITGRSSSNPETMSVEETRRRMLSWRRTTGVRKNWCARNS